MGVWIHRGVLDVFFKNKAAQRRLRWATMKGGILYYAAHGIFELTAAMWTKLGKSAQPRHREERSDAAIHKCLIGKPKWIASLRSQ
jgi:hypothetical protein